MEKERYWSQLTARGVERYKIRTSLTHCYVLQLSGKKGNRRHRATLYCHMLVGDLKPVWTTTFCLDNGQSPEDAKHIACTLLKEMIQGPKTHLKHVNYDEHTENELLAAVDKIVEETAVEQPNQDKEATTMSFPTYKHYKQKPVYAADMESVDVARPVALYRDRSAAGDAAGIARNLVPAAKFIYHGDDPVPGEAAHRRILAKNGKCVAATDWYRSPADAAEECHVMLRKGEHDFDAVLSQTGAIT